MKKQYLITILLFLVTASVWAEESIIQLTVTSTTASNSIKLYASANNTPVQIDWGAGKVEEVIPATGKTVNGISPIGTIIVYADPATIQQVEINNRNMTHADFSKASGLTRLKCESNEKLTSLTLPEVTTNLQKLELNSNSIAGLDLSGYLNLTTLSCSRHKLLETLTLPGEGNELKEFTSTYNMNSLRSLDMSTCSKLEKISLRGYPLLETFTLPTNGDALKELSCVEINLTTLDVSKYINLTELDCEYNYITSLILPAEPKAVFSVSCAYNMLPLAALPEGTFTAYYAPQREAVEYALNETYTTDDTIDLSQWYTSKKGTGYNYNADGILPTFTWYVSGNSTPLVVDEAYTVTDGCKFKFTEVPTGKVYCLITHAGYPSLSGSEAYKTNEVTIEQGLVLDNLMELTVSSLTASNSIKLYASENNTPVQIDWGAGKIKEMVPATGKTFSGISPTGTIVVYADPATIQQVEINNRNMTHADFSRASGLTRLKCESNEKLTSLSLPEVTTNLQKLELNSNSITNLDLSTYLNLTTLTCNRHKLLETLTLPGEGNELKEFTSTYNMNSIRSLDMSVCSKLETISLRGYPLLETLILPTNGDALKELSCVEINLTSLDVSKYINLTELNCEYNNIASLILPDEPKSNFTLSCAYNMLTFANLPEGPYTIYYSPQRSAVKYEIDESYTTNDIVDLSQWYIKKKGVGYSYDVNGKYPTFVWHLEGSNDALEIGVDYFDLGEGKFQFPASPEKAVYCEILHTGYPYMKDEEGIKTNSTIIIYVPEPTELVITMLSEATEALEFVIGSTMDGTKIEVETSTGKANQFISAEGTVVPLTTGGEIKIYANPAKINYLDVSGMQLSLLDATACVSLEELNCSNNNLTVVNYPTGDVFKQLNCANNKLTLATLPYQWTGSSTAFVYAPQEAFVIEDADVAGSTIDLSALYITKKGISDTDEYLPEFIWYEAGETTPLVEDTDYTVEDGCKFTFIFQGTKAVYAIVTSQAYPDFKDDKAYKTTAYTIQNPVVGIGENNMDGISVSCKNNIISIFSITPYDYSVISVSGSVVATGHSVNSEKIPCASGVYIIKIKTEQTEQYHKVMVTR